MLVFSHLDKDTTLPFKKSQAVHISISKIVKANNLNKT